MKKAALLLVIVLLLVAGYWLFTKRYMFLSPDGLHASLAEQWGSGVSGTATLTEGLTGVLLDVQLSGSGDYLAQIRGGTCSEPGEILYTTPLNSSINTSLSTLVGNELLSIEIVAAQEDQFAPEEMKSLACGEVTLK